MGKKMQDTCVAYGYFDGMHKGHINVAKKTVETAKEKGLTSVVVSCKKVGEVLSTEEEKEYLFKETGVQEFVYRDYEEMAEEDFIKNVLVEEYGAKVIVLGENHSNVAKV